MCCRSACVCRAHDFKRFLPSSSALRQQLSTTGTIDQTILEAGRVRMALEEEMVIDVQQAAMLNSDETSCKKQAQLLCSWTVVSAKTVYITIGYRSCELLVVREKGRLSRIGGALAENESRASGAHKRRNNCEQFLDVSFGGSDQVGSSQTSRSTTLGRWRLRYFNFSRCAATQRRQYCKRVNHFLATKCRVDRGRSCPISSISNGLAMQ